MLCVFQINASICINHDIPVSFYNSCNGESEWWKGAHFVNTRQVHYSFANFIFLTLFYFLLYLQFFYLVYINSLFLHSVVNKFYLVFECTLLLIFYILGSLYWCFSHTFFVFHIPQKFSALL